MPEGPELHHASMFINHVCKGRVFAGKIKKSEVHKSAEVDWNHGDYTISASSRGKEMKMTITAVDTHDEKESKKKNVTSKSLDILVQFGMSGRFNFCDVDDMEKHSHLNFFTKPEKGSPLQVLSFVDYRRFGKWQVGADWSPDRGPCVLLEYPAFRERVLSRLNETAFNKPICEVLLNQKYFNGIGNYLRAEILYRCKVRPFDCARSVLEKLSAGDGEKKVVIKSESPDILELCHLLPREVVDLGANGYIPNNEKSMTKFTDWLQCYYNPNMNNMADHNKRTMWFSGDPGPMVPKEQKVRGVKKTSKIVKRKTEQMIEAGEELPEILKSPTKKKKTDGARVTRRKLKDAIKEETNPERKPKSAKSTKSKRSKSEETGKPKVVRSSKSIKTSKPSKRTPKTKNSRSKSKIEVSVDIQSLQHVHGVNGNCVLDSGDGKEASVPKPIVTMRRMTRTSSRESTNSSRSSSSVSNISNGASGLSKDKKRLSRKAVKS